MYGSLEEKSLDLGFNWLSVNKKRNGRNYEDYMYSKIPIEPRFLWAFDWRTFGCSIQALGYTTRKLKFCLWELQSLKADRWTSEHSRTVGYSSNCCCLFKIKNDEPNGRNPYTRNPQWLGGQSVEEKPPLRVVLNLRGMSGKLLRIQVDRSSLWVWVRSVQEKEIRLKVI